MASLVGYSVGPFCTLVTQEVGASVLGPLTQVEGDGGTCLRVGLALGASMSQGQIDTC